MTEQAALPILQPTLPGKAEGVTCLDPPTLQCQECGATATPASVEWTSGGWDAVVLTSGLHFHVGGWPDGSNPRLCRPCRVARGCNCWSCTSARRTA